MTDKLLEIFLAEAQELISDLEKALLKLEDDPADKEGVGTVFRAMHTLKGSAGMFGFDGVNLITHHLESIYQDIRDGKRIMNAVVLGTTFRTLDHLRHLMDDPQLQNPMIRERHDALMEEIAGLQDSHDESTINVSLSKPVVSETPRTYYIYLLPTSTILKNGNNTFYLIEDLLALGHGVALPFFKELPTLENIIAENSYTGFEIVLSTSKPEADIQEVFMFVEGNCEIVIKKLADADLFKNQLAEAHLWRGHDLFLPKGFEGIRSVLYSNPHREKETVADMQKANNYSSSIRVSADRLDDLMNLVSELVTTQASLSLCSKENNSSEVHFGELANITENIEKITKRLRDNAFSMSLIPLESLVVRFQRLVRDLSKELKKEIQFKTDGTDTEIDKSIIEKLSDPLLHLLRNAIDHGIEEPELRLKNGKPAQGTVLLKSYYSGANVVIEISDDGAGINLNKVKEKGISQGIIEADTHLSEKELLNLIFLPGFSTASQITGVSGRGVGMDVVKRNITDIRGEIEVSTKVGQGSTFQIKLPLTLSIIDGLRVEIGSTEFILPLLAVQKCYEIITTQLTETFNQWVTLDGQRIPFLFLREDFGATNNAPFHSQIIKIIQNGNPVGLVVDRIIGDYQAVLKPLGHFYQNQDEFSGATILGNGTVALVIDPVKLTQKHNLSQEALQKRLAS